MVEIKAENITKAYSYKLSVFKNINLDLKSGDSLSITGRNGSGKSTLLKSLSNLISINSGKLTYKIDGMEINKNDFNSYYGILTPYLNIYEEFTPIELLTLTNNIRGYQNNLEYNLELLKTVELYKRKDDKISEFSSGMKQRIKLCLALCHRPKALFLDEPFTNLDSSGIEILQAMINEFKSQNGLLIIATNDENEKKLCEKNIELIVNF